VDTCKKNIFFESKYWAIKIYGPRLGHYQCTYCNRLSISYLSLNRSPVPVNLTKLVWYILQYSDDRKLPNIVFHRICMVGDGFFKNYSSGP